MRHNRQLDEAKALLKRISELSPKFVDGQFVQGTQKVYCFFCNWEGDNYDDPIVHDADCPWAKARALS